MKAGHFFVSVLTVFAVGMTVGCGKLNTAKSDQQEADELKTEGNQRIAATAKNEQEIKDRYEIELSTADTSAKDFDWSQFPPAKRKVIASRLQGQISNVNRIFEIANHKNMKMTGTGASLKTSRNNAQLYLNSLNDFENKVATAPK